MPMSPTPHRLNRRAGPVRVRPHRAMLASVATGLLAIAPLSGCDSGGPQTQYERTVEAQENLEEARERAAEIVSEAEDDAITTVHDAREQAQEEIRDAKEEAAAMVRKAEEELQEEMSALGEQPLAEPAEAPDATVIIQDAEGDTAVLREDADAR